MAKLLQTSTSTSLSAEPSIRWMTYEYVIVVLFCLSCITGTASTPKNASAAPLRAASGAEATCGARIEDRTPGRTWRTVTLDRWLPAIEGYKACVTAANQEPIGIEAVDFASYLDRIHNRVHPIFAVSYLQFLDRFDGAARVPNETKVTIEMVVSGKEGSLVSIGVIASSGVTAFDISALESVSRASPFGAPPQTIASPDGNVYLHWQLSRDPNLGCATSFMKPYKLRTVASFREP